MAGTGIPTYDGLSAGTSYRNTTANRADAFLNGALLSRS